MYYKYVFISMVTKIMDQQKNCQGCSQRQDCQQAYQKLANFRGSSIVLKVIVAFLLPIMVFIASVAASERILAEAIPHQFCSYFAGQDSLTENWCGTKELRTALSFLLALSVTFGLILIVKLIDKQFSKNK